MKNSRLLLTMTVAAYCQMALQANAQTIQNVRATFLNGKVQVTYDLLSKKSNQKFVLDLFSSHNNYSTPLVNVVGDIGKDVAPGLGKKIEWDASAELDSYQGEILFKIKGEALPLPFSFTSPAEGGSMRRGKKINVQWEGGRTEQTVKLDLFQDGQRVQSIAETKNSGAFSWLLPKDLKKGSYTVKLNAGLESAQSGVFIVKSKIPLLVKCLPVLVVGGALASLGGGGGGGGGTPIQTSSDLPIAPNPK